MNKFLIFSFVIFSIKIFSSNPDRIRLVKEIKEIGLDRTTEEFLKIFLFLEDVNTYKELTENDQSRFSEILSSRHTKIITKISLLRNILGPDNSEKNKMVIKLLFNHISNLEGLAVYTIAALEVFDRILDLDDPTINIQSIISDRSKAKVFMGEYKDCFPLTIRGRFSPVQPK